MRQSLFLLLCLIGGSSVTYSIMTTVPHKYYLVQTPKTWTLAQNYCREMYTDLATVESDRDWARLKTAVSSVSSGTWLWLGLYADMDSWQWTLNNLSLKNATFTKWYFYNPDNIGGREYCAIVEGSAGYWIDFPCTDLKPFICYNASRSGASKFVAVPYPVLNWNAARAYCQQFHTDLASAVNATDNDVLRTLSLAQGYSWFGLYRNGWKWSDGTNGSKLLWYPGQPDQTGPSCGHLYYGLLADYLCNTQLYFVCHTVPPVREQQIVKLHLRIDTSVFDSTAQSAVLDLIKLKLEEFGLTTNITVTWRKQPNGDIFDMN